MIWDHYQGQLTADPIREVTLRTGKTALVLLFLSLACTPAGTLFGLKQAMRVRRALGLYAAVYAGLHFSIFVGLDYGFDLGLIAEDILGKPFALLGLASGLVLLPLTALSIRRLAAWLGQTWRRLRWWVYGAAFLAVLHFVWLAKGDKQEPLIYGAIAILLMVVRLPVVVRAARRLRGS
jgi:sulfoxide reductase heme-binding subunit YedZ